jgi:hypothetical protein
MAKYRTIGTVNKSKDNPKETYIKVKEDVTLKAGQFVSVINPRTLADKLESEGKVSAEIAAKIRERGEKTPDWVLFELQIKNDQE